MIKFDQKVYDSVMRLEDEPSYKLARKRTRRFVSKMSEVEKIAVLERSDEISEGEVEGQLENKSILERLGFTDEEAGVLMDKRLGTPGMKNLIAMRAREVGMLLRLRRGYERDRKRVMDSFRAKMRADPSHSRQLREQGDATLARLRVGLLRDFVSLGTTLEFPEEWLEG